MSKISKMVFAAFMYTAYRVLLLISLMSKVLKMSNTMYSVNSSLLPLPGGKTICYSI